MSFYLCIIPFITYWTTCLILNILDIGTITEKKNNLNVVSKYKVFTNVLNGTLNHYLINLLLYNFEILDIYNFRYMYILYGIILIDTIEYVMHRALHEFNFLYKYHKVHHEINNPYNFGALYNSKNEGIIEASLLLSGFIVFKFSFLEYIIVLSLANFATVLDHTNLNIKKKFHYLHHSKYQNYNYQQPFFTYWDRIFGTYKV
jgi:sphinganine C4-monooxygenase